MSGIDPRWLLPVLAGDWRTRAECRHHVGMFDDSLLGESKADREKRYQAAIRICTTKCPVLEDCRKSIVYGVDEGVLGGKVVKLPKPVPHRAVEIVHGTEKGAKQHYRRQEQPCRPCLDAANAADRDRRRRQAEREAIQPCGTYGGYRRHHTAREAICDPCRLARNAYDREVQMRRRREERDRRAAS